MGDYVPNRVRARLGVCHGVTLCGLQINRVPTDSACPDARDSGSAEGIHPEINEIVGRHRQVFLVVNEWTRVRDVHILH